MAIFVRKSKTSDGDVSGKKEQGSIFRSKKNLDTLKQDQMEVTETSIPQPRTSYAPSSTHNTMKRRTSSSQVSMVKSSTSPRRSDLSMPETDVERTRSIRTDRSATDRSTGVVVKHSDHFPRMDMHTISDSPTLGYSRPVVTGKDRGYFPTNHSDSGYESTETSFLPVASDLSGASADMTKPSDLESRSAKSSKSSKPGIFHRKRPQKNIRDEAATAPSLAQDLTGLTPASHETPAMASSPGLLLPPISTLDGFKVNTKGRLLDEEGDVIGELFEGDLLDCVRQKANAFGEVLDDFGRVVGRVRTVPRSAGTPSMHAISPHVMPQRCLSQRSTEPAPISPLLLPVGQELTSGGTLSELMRRGQARSPADYLNVENETLREIRSGSEASVGALPDQSVTGPSFSAGTTIATGADKQTRPTRSMPSLNEPRDKSEKASSSPSVTFASPECRFTDEPAEDRPKIDRPAPGFSRSQSRMSINSILANRTPEEGRSTYTPSLFSYKGEIPAADGPQGNARLRSQPSSIYSSNSRQSAPALNVKIAHISSGAGQRRVQVTDNLMGMPLTRPTLGTRNSVSSSYKRSPLSSADVTPSESTDGTDHSVSDDGKSPVSHYSPAPSLYAGRSAHTPSNASMRTYFTHAGRVTVQTDEETSAQPAPAPSPKPAEAIPSKETEKKKGRFAIFGKK